MNYVTHVCIYFACIFLFHEWLDRRMLLFHFKLCTDHSLHSWFERRYAKLSLRITDLHDTSEADAKAELSWIPNTMPHLASIWCFPAAGHYPRSLFWALEVQPRREERHPCFQRYVWSMRKSNLPNNFPSSACHCNCPVSQKPWRFWRMFYYSFI